MQINKKIFAELIKQGYSVRAKRRVWDISDGKLWCLTPELVKGYEKFEKYAPYRQNVVVPETQLVKKNLKKIAKSLGKRFNIIDLGCGDGKKAEALIKSLPNSVKVRYYPVDISKILVKRAEARMKKVGKKKVAIVKPINADFMEYEDIGGRVRNSEYQKNLILLLGGTISHLDIHDILYHLSKELFHGDLFVIGNGLRKGKRFVALQKYKVPQIDNWFMNTLREIGFKEEEVKCDARFSHGRLELYYTVLSDKRIHLGKKTVYFREGDEILVALQYKFYDKEIVKICKMYFPEVELHKSKGGEFCLAFCRK